MRSIRRRLPPAMSLPAWGGGIALGAELLTNGGFEGVYDDESSGGGGTVNIAPNWNNFGSELDGTDTLDETADAHGGSKAQEITVNAANEGVTSAATIVFASGKRYYFELYIKGVAGKVRIFDGAAAIIDETFTPSTGAYRRYYFIRAGSTTSQRIYITSGDAGAHFIVDDVSVKEIL